MQAEWKAKVTGEPVHVGPRDGETVHVYLTPNARGSAPTYGPGPGVDTDTMLVVFEDGNYKAVLWPTVWSNWTPEQRQARLDDDTLLAYE